MRCKICHRKTDDYSMWQPLGPDEHPLSAFAAPGHHYRGWPVLAVCDRCKAEIKGRSHFVFFYDRRNWLINGDEVTELVDTYNVESDVISQE